MANLKLLYCQLWAMTEKHCKTLLWKQLIFQMLLRSNIAVHPKSTRNNDILSQSTLLPAQFNYNNHTSTAKWKQSWNQSITVNIAERNYAVLGETEKLTKHTKQTTNTQGTMYDAGIWKCGVLRHYLHHVQTWIPTDEQLFMSTTQIYKSQ